MLFEMVVGPLGEDAVRTLDKSGRCVYKCIKQGPTWAITSLLLLLRNCVCVCMAVVFFSPQDFLALGCFPCTASQWTTSYWCIAGLNTVLELIRQWLLLCFLPQECYKVLFRVSLCYTTKRNHHHFLSRQKDLIKNRALDQDWPLS